MYIEIKLDVSDFKALIEQKLQELRAGWIKGPASEFHQKFLMTTEEHFERLRLGGTWRGETWPYFSPASFGRKRSSGAVLKPGDALLQDTGLLRSRAGQVFRDINPFEIRIETNLEYAAEHNYGDTKKRLPARPFQFFTDDDRGDLEKFTREWLES